MDLSTTYLGLKLKNPLIPSAGPISESIDSIKRLEESGAAAVVLYSLFEEQLMMEKLELHHHMTEGTESFAESLSYFPEPVEYKLGPDEYLEHIRKAKAAVNIPIIASLNGSTLGGWTAYARLMQDAGADAIELNIYFVPTDIDTPGSVIEQRYIDIVKAVKQTVSIPVAVKLSPFFSNMANMAKKLDAAGANGLVLFNRFYQPDINLEKLEIQPNIMLSTPFANRLPLTWIGLLHGRINADMAATSGIHNSRDVLKMIMAGAKATMLMSALLRHGVEHLLEIQREMIEWMEENEYDSIEQMQGSMSQIKTADPSAYERAQYMKALTSYKPDKSFFVFS